ncbi:MAG TPA: protein kinase [Vicinamibacterales bacterium]|nr:protein kinase [Vicinamibacterales bacterium]
MALTEGTRLGSYVIAARIGAGGMGEVYRARDTRLGRDVAIKTLPHALTTDPERLARLEREARMLGALNHPNIATLHGIEDHGEIRALIMELVAGPTLEELIARRGSSAPATATEIADALTIARQIADALDAAHQKNIIHRDLKPANVKITPDGVVKVLDFGLAKAALGDSAGPGSDAATTAALSSAGLIVGTVGYMSPEQARGQDVDKRADIWAFGCVLYEMLAGRSAFSRGTVSDSIAAVLNSEPDWQALPPGLSPNIRRLLERCLEKSPKRRLRDIGDARHELEDPVPAAATPPVEQSSAASAVPPARRVSRRGMLIGGALGLLGLGFGAGALVGGRPRVATLPSFRRLTFRRGMIRTARFGPDYKTIYYGALWDGDICRVYTVRPESPESAPVTLPPATPLAISSSGELALALGTHMRGIMTYGTLARVPLAGGAPRELLEEVKYADWSPDGRELAVVRRVKGREQLEFPMGTVIAEPATPGGGFSFPRVSPRGDSVACFELGAASALNGHVVLVDRSGARTTFPSRYFNVFGLAWNRDEIWFTAADELPLFRNAVYAVTRSGEPRLVSRVPGNATLHDVAPDGRLLIARTDDRGGISVLAPGDTQERDLAWLDGPSLADISRDGSLVLFSETGVGGGAQASVYLRKTDGSPAVRLGDGRAVALSPDGQWAIADGPGQSGYDVLPTGAGQPRRLERQGLTIFGAKWLPDGQRVVARAQESDRHARLYLFDLDRGTADAITPENISIGASWAVSPDGTMAAVVSERGLNLHPIGGGPTRLVPGLTGRERLYGWIRDGVLVSEPQAVSQVLRVDPLTGRRQVWKEIQPRDPTGIMTVTFLVPTPDGRAYAYSWHRALSDLYLVEGLR